MTRANHQHQQQQEPAQNSGSAMGGTAERAAAFKRVWQDTHPDFRGKLADGTLTVMGYAKWGGGLVTAETITEDELAERLQAVRK